MDPRKPPHMRLCNGKRTESAICFKEAAMRVPRHRYNMHASRPTEASVHRSSRLSDYSERKNSGQSPFHPGLRSQLCSLANPYLEPTRHPAPSLSVQPACAQGPTHHCYKHKSANRHKAVNISETHTKQLPSCSIPNSAHLTSDISLRSR